MSKRLEVDQTKAFDDQQNPYDVQNVLIQQHRFPQYYYREDYMFCLYEDRDYESWEKAWKALEEIGHTRKGQGAESALAQLEPVNFLNFCKIFLNNKEITGARAIRYTNVSNGYPCIAIQGFKAHEDSPKEEVYSSIHAPNVVFPDGIGYRMYGDTISYF